MFVQSGAGSASPKLLPPERARDSMAPEPPAGSFGASACSRRFGRGDDPTISGWPNGIDGIRCLMLLILPCRRAGHSAGTFGAQCGADQPSFKTAAGGKRRPSLLCAVLVLLHVWLSDWLFITTAAAAAYCPIAEYSAANRRLGYSRPSACSTSSVHLGVGLAANPVAKAGIILSDDLFSAAISIVALHLVPITTSTSDHVRRRHRPGPWLSTVPTPDLGAGALDVRYALVCDAYGFGFVSHQVVRLPWRAARRYRIEKFE